MQGIGFTSIRLRIGKSESPCECDIESPGSILHEVYYKIYNTRANNIVK